MLQQFRETHAFRAMARSRDSAQTIQGLGAEPALCSLADVSASHLEGCDAVIHSAAFLGPWGKRRDYWEANVVGTERLLDAAKSAGVQRFVHIGTEAALFRGQHMRNIDETYPYPSSTPFLYSETKKEAEIRVLAANTSEFETISLRPRLIWGPGDQTVLPELVRMVEGGQFAWINGGKAKTSTAHIENVVHAISLALQQGEPGEAYFITDDEYITYRDFLSRLLATQGLTPPDRSMPGWLLGGAASLLEGVWGLLPTKSPPPLTKFAVSIMARDCTLQIGKAKQKLGYEPQITVNEGLKQLTA